MRKVAITLKIVQIDEKYFLVCYKKSRCDFDDELYKLGVQDTTIWSK